MQTIVIDIINKKAVRLLRDLELLQLIRVRNEKKVQRSSIDWAAKYKGAMTKQSPAEIDRQLSELRNEWD